MVVKVYISGISGNKEVKKRQQRVLMILDSKNIKYEIIDITEPGRESDKDFMQHNSLSNGGTVSDPNPRSPLPPQVFNEEEYCGDYDKFDLANEVDTLEQFLKLEVPPESPTPAETEIKTNTVNGDVNLNLENTQETEDRTQETLPEDVKEDDKNGAAKGDSVEKEISPDRKMSVDAIPAESKEDTTTDETDINLEDTTISKEVVNANGAVSSREVSQDKESQETVEQEKDNPSEALIQNEQAAASD